jgi:hypothetical protein
MECQKTIKKMVLQLLVPKQQYNTNEEAKLVNFKFIPR